MLELGIFCVIVLAAGYWAALWLMGRRDDVLHGKFVMDEPAVERTAVPSQAAPPANADVLQSLLAVIKQDLKDAAKI